MKKALILGGAGFIGSWMCQKMKDEGFYVEAVDRKMPEFGWAPADAYQVFDLLNPVDFYDQLRFQDADVVLQFAAEMGGAGYVFTGEHDADIMHHSATINLHVLEACRRWEVPKVFFASSACVYPSLSPIKLQYNDVDNTACREQDAGSPDSPYGLEKLFSESLYDSYRRNHGIDVKIGRFHNIYGAYGTWRGGREKAPAALCRKIAEIPQGGDIEIFGNGQQTRSFLHASEAVEGVWRLMQSDFSGPVNIGSSEMVSIDRLAYLIGEVAGKLFTITHVPGPLGVMGRNSDNSLVEAKLGWKPSRTLREGLEETYPWIAEQVEKARALTPATL